MDNLNCFYDMVNECFQITCFDMDGNMWNLEKYKTFKQLQFLKQQDSPSLNSVALYLNNDDESKRTVSLGQLDDATINPEFIIVGGLKLIPYVAIPYSITK